MFDPVYMKRWKGHIDLNARNSIKRWLKSIIHKTQSRQKLIHQINSSENPLFKAWDNELRSFVYLTKEEFLQTLKGGI